MRRLRARSVPETVTGDAPEAKARWNRAHKFVRLGISEEQFAALLEIQGYACAMCHAPFEEGQRIFADPRI